MQPGPVGGTARSGVALARALLHHGDALVDMQKVDLRFAQIVQAAVTGGIRPAISANARSPNLR